MLIGGHSDAASLGEVSFLGKAIALRQDCSCGQKVIDCREWGKIFTHVNARRGIDLLKHPYALRQWDTRAGVLIDRAQQTRCYLLGAKVRSAWCDLRYWLRAKGTIRLRLPLSLERGVNNTLYLYEVVRSEWNKQTVIDSSKNVHKALAVYECARDQARIILLTRDGRGVYYSLRNSGFSRAESASGWYCYYSRAVPLLSRCVAPDHLLTIKYEELVTNLEASMRTICEFLEIPFEKRMVNLSVGERHLVNGNETRFHKDRGVRLDERWKKGLADEELRYFLTNCGQLNLRLGYQ